MKIKQERKFTLTMNKYEASLLKELLASVQGEGKEREFFDSIYEGLKIRQSKVLEGTVQVKFWNNQR